MKKKLAALSAAMFIGFIGGAFTVKSEAASNVLLASTEWVLSQINPMKDRITTLENKVNQLSNGGSNPQVPVQGVSDVVTKGSTPVRRGASITERVFFTAPAGTALTYSSTYTNAKTGEKWYIVKLADGRAATVLASKSSVSISSVTSFSSAITINTTAARRSASPTGIIYKNLAAGTVVKYSSTFTAADGQKWYIVKLSDGRAAAILASSAEGIK
ncbi:hypothetical protein IHV12_04020 [Fictibacillus sp. 7GRE50]|uniref:hypothetical protein n=1 Tax=Fictibacillus sp. 7GRE50 TaxID=2745878 RepID=UPI0018CE5BFC|nr:hypothetical protein [Fictibacillus sp. 7GRE50]MBH0164066.1 hypothetical protein [Fictibacillus sp. 7GRE50]